MADDNIALKFPTSRDEKRAALLAAVEAIRSTVLENAAESERLGTLAPPTVAALRETGLLSLKLPEALGGAEADPALQFDVIESISAIDPSTGWCLMIGGTGIGLPGSFLADEAIAEMFAGGRVPTGAIMAVPTGEAMPLAGGYRVSGRWAFVSGAPHAEWFTLGAKVVSTDGAPAVPRLFVVPAKAVTLHDNWQVMGLRGTGSCDVSLDGCFVPEAFTWDRFRSPPLRGGALYRLSQPGFVANEHAAFATGAARGAVDAIKHLAREKRRSFALEPSSIEARPVFQRFVGLADLRLRAVRALVLEVYAEAWEFGSVGEVPPPRVQAAIRAACAYATEVAVDVTTEAFSFRRRRSGLRGPSAATLPAGYQRRRAAPHDEQHRLREPRTVRSWSTGGRSVTMMATPKRCVATSVRGASSQVAVVLVRTAGLEPARRCRLGILSPVCLPVPPRPQPRHPAVPEE